MAIIKVVNIKKTPIKNLKYIANNEKTLNGDLIAAIIYIKPMKKWKTLIGIMAKRMKLK